jgi:hypothetical protein
LPGIGVNRKKRKPNRGSGKPFFATDLNWD